MGLLSVTKVICKLNQATERCDQSVKSEEVNLTMPQIINEIYYVALSPPSAVSS